MMATPDSILDAMRRLVDSTAAIRARAQVELDKLDGPVTAAEVDEKQETRHKTSVELLRGTLDDLCGVCRACVRLCHASAAVHEAELSLLTGAIQEELVDRNAEWERQIFELYEGSGLEAIRRSTQAAHSEGYADGVRRGLRDAADHASGDATRRDERCSLPNDRLRAEADRLIARHERNRLDGATHATRVAQDESLRRCAELRKAALHAIVDP